jgi:hypothetical protein
MAVIYGSVVCILLYIVFIAHSKFFTQVIFFSSASCPSALKVGSIYNIYICMRNGKHMFYVIDRRCTTHVRR